MGTDRLLDHTHVHLYPTGGSHKLMIDNNISNMEFKLYLLITTGKESKCPEPISNTYTHFLRVKDDPANLNISSTFILAGV